jgi:hypothetical protein
VSTSLERNLLWLLGGTAGCVALAWIAFQIQQEHVAPALLFPVAAGTVLAGLLLVIVRYTQPRRSVAITSAVIWGLLLVAGQDYIGHRQRLANLEAELARSHPLASALASEHELRPTFARHLAGRLQAEPLSWPLDFILTAATASLVLAVGTRQKKSASRQPQ